VLNSVVPSAEERATSAAGRVTRDRAADWCVGRSAISARRADCRSSGTVRRRGSQSSPPGRRRRVRRGAGLWPQPVRASGRATTRRCWRSLAESCPQVRSVVVAVQRVVCPIPSGGGRPGHHSPNGRGRASSQPRDREPRLRHRRRDATPPPPPAPPERGSRHPADSTLPASRAGAVAAGRCCRQHADLPRSGRRAAPSCPAADYAPPPAPTRLPSTTWPAERTSPPETRRTRSTIREATHRRSPVLDSRLKISGVKKGNGGAGIRGRQVPVRSLGR
jgi:hypothetical protein